MLLESIALTLAKIINKTSPTRALQVMFAGRAASPTSRALAAENATNQQEKRKTTTELRYHVDLSKTNLAA